MALRVRAAQAEARNCTAWLRCWFSRVLHARQYRVIGYSNVGFPVHPVPHSPPESRPSSGPWPAVSTRRIQIFHANVAAADPPLSRFPDRHCLPVSSGYALYPSAQVVRPRDQRGRTRPSRPRSWHCAIRATATRVLSTPYRDIGYSVLGHRVEIRCILRVPVRPTTTAELP